MFDIFTSKLFTDPFFVYGPTKQLLESEQTNSLYHFEDMLNGLLNKHVQNKDGNQIISFDMPGIKESDIEMEYDSDSGNLFIKAERKLDHKHYAYSNKTFVGKGLASDSIKANFEDNVLQLTINSNTELPKPVHKILLNK